MCPHIRPIHEILRKSKESMARTSLLLAAALSDAAALRLPPRFVESSRQHAAALACVATLAMTPIQPAMANSCQLDCFRECNKVAPGSGAYCTSQCDTYCEEVGDSYQSDVVRGEATPAPAVADGKDCGKQFKTEAAVKYCEGQKVAAAKAAQPYDPLAMNNGIFGDSGVTYSKGVEDLLAPRRAAAEVAQSAGALLWRAPTRLLEPLTAVLVPGRSLAAVGSADSAGWELWHPPGCPPAASEQLNSCPVVASTHRRPPSAPPARTGTYADLRL